MSVTSRVWWLNIIFSRWEEWLTFALPFFKLRIVDHSLSPKMGRQWNYWPRFQAASCLAVTMASSSEAPESGGASRTLHGVEMKHSAKVNVYHVTVNHRCCVMFKMFGFLRTYFLFLNYTLGLLLSASIHTCNGAYTRVKNYTNLC